MAGPPGPPREEPGSRVSGGPCARSRQQVSLLHTVHVPLGSSRRTCTRNQSWPGLPHLCPSCITHLTQGCSGGSSGPGFLGGSRRGRFKNWEKAGKARQRVKGWRGWRESTGVCRVGQELGRESPLSLSSRLVGKGERGRGPAGSGEGSVLEKSTAPGGRAGSGFASEL